MRHLNHQITTRKLSIYLDQTNVLKLYSSRGNSIARKVKKSDFKSNSKMLKKVKHTTKKNFKINEIKVNSRIPTDYNKKINKAFVKNETRKKVR